MAVPVGRDRELDAVKSLLGQVEFGLAVLVLSGEAGIGKTTIWQAGVDEAAARRFTVLASRPAVSDVPLSFTGLTDLLADVSPERLEDLPRPQRRALEAALLRG